MFLGSAAARWRCRRPKAVRAVCNTPAAGHEYGKLFLLPGRSVPVCVLAGYWPPSRDECQSDVLMRTHYPHCHVRVFLLRAIRSSSPFRCYFAGGSRVGALLHFVSAPCPPPGRKPIKVLFVRCRKRPPAPRFCSSYCYRRRRHFGLVNSVGTGRICHIELDGSARWYG